MLPFKRGWNRVDFYAASLIASSQIFNNPDLAFSVIEGIEPILFKRANPGDFSRPAYQIAYTGTYFFICVAGTQTWSQWVSNILLSDQVFADEDFQDRYFVAVANIINLLEIFAFNNYIPISNVVLIGHSLGGAVCQALHRHFIFKYPNYNGRCFVLGCPRVGDPAFAEAINSTTFRAEDRDDPVTGVPPELWVAFGSNFPVPGPGIPVQYEHGGEAKTLETDFSITDGSFAPSTPEVVVLMNQGAIVNHYAQEYARRLRGGLTLSDLTPAATGYADPAVLDDAFTYWFDRPDVPPNPVKTRTGGQGMRKFTLFFNIGTHGGVTESFWADVLPNFYTSVIATYLQFRLALSDAYFKFQYCRISDPANPRKVSWRTRSDFASPDGTWGGLGDSQPEQALLLRLTMNDYSQGRIFIHGFPSTQFNGEDYTPSAAYTAAVNAFLSSLKTQSIQYRMTVAHTLADRFIIQSFTPDPPRGAIITPATAPTLHGGDRITIGGVDQTKVVGLNGRKVVIDQAIPGGPFRIGGAVPVGTIAGPGNIGYFYDDPDNFQGIDPTLSGVERLTKHNVGRPFGVKVGRARATIPLRQ